MDAKCGPSNLQLPAGGLASNPNLQKLPNISGPFMIELVAAA
jgi:hypothetical protein